MCGRYTHYFTWRELYELYRLITPVDPRQAEARYNAAPTQELPVVIAGAEGRELRMMRWGLIPFWSKDGGQPYSTINARAEGLMTRPVFREPFRRRRCLVPASGFYEWRREGKYRQPYYITLPDGAMTFAGVWDRWRGPEGLLCSFAIVTTAAAAAISHLHDRMPAILAAEDWDAWLDAETPLPVLEDMLRPWRGELAICAVSRAVNSPAMDEPRLIEPIILPVQEDRPGRSG